MNKVIFRFWLINILTGIALYIVFRIVISETNHEDGDFWTWLLQILDILLNLAYSFIYLIAMAICSSAIFLNSIDKIRNNFYLSFLTFLGLPVCGVIFIAGIMITEKLLEHDEVTIFRNLLTFSIAYLLFTTLQFLLFRKKINKPDFIEVKSY